MTSGQGNITYKGITLPSGAPFGPGAASNGLSVDPVTGMIVLGNNVGGLLATLLSDREIAMDDFLFQFTNNGGRQFLIDPLNERYQIGDIDNLLAGTVIDIISAFSTINFIDNALAFAEFDPALIRMGDLPQLFGGLSLTIDSTNEQFRVLGQNAGLNIILWMDIDQAAKTVSLGDITPGFNGTKIFLDDGNQLVNIETAVGPMMDLNQLAGLYRFGDIGGVGNTTRMVIDDATEAIRLSSNGENVIELDHLNALYRFGGLDSANGNRIEIDDTAGDLIINNAAANMGILINGVAGFTGTVAPPLTITVNNGIVTNVA